MVGGLPTVGFVGTYKRGSSSSFLLIRFLQVLPPIVDLFELAFSLSLLCFLVLFEEKERGDLDPHSPPSQLSSK